MFSCAVGTDRAGSMYRFAAYEMLKRMRLRTRYSQLSDDISEQALEKRAIGKLYWGIFCFERYVLDHRFAASVANCVPDSFRSLASQAFLQPSMMETPWMDSPYPASPAGATKDDNVDIFGEPYRTDAAVGPPMVVGAKFAAFQLCKLMNQVMEYLHRGMHGTGSAVDLQRRTEFYTLLSNLGKSFPPSLQLGHNFTHQVCFLWYVVSSNPLTTRLKHFYH